MKRILCLAAAALVVCACHKEQKSQVTIVSGQKSVVNETHRMPVYDLTDTARLNGKSYVFSIHREPCDTLPMVSDEAGVRYADNLYRLRITRDGGQPFFDHTFSKAQFGARLTPEFRAHGILDGFRFVGAQEGQLQFAVCVSLPESDMSAPFLLTIGRDAGYSIAPDNVMDVEEDFDEEEEDDSPLSKQ